MAVVKVQTVVVSTHSRPKAAGGGKRTALKLFLRFNTQPPEGGWAFPQSADLQPCVSTHSRPKAAGLALPVLKPQMPVSTHSRPKAAGYKVVFGGSTVRVSTHSRPKAAGGFYVPACSIQGVSTHSRPKAAGSSHLPYQRAFFCFNTQPPEGGWFKTDGSSISTACFNTQPPEGGWAAFLLWFIPIWVSTHSRPKAAGAWVHRLVERPHVSTHSRPKAAGFYKT